MPDLKDHEDVQRFFLQEVNTIRVVSIVTFMCVPFKLSLIRNAIVIQVQIGEEMLTCGDIDGGIEHLANAVAVCGQPTQLLQVLQKTLPPQVFHLLLQRLPIIGQVCI